MTTVLMVISITMNKVFVYSVWKILIKNMKTLVLFVVTEVPLKTLNTVVTVVLMIISQLVHTDTVAHSTTDMMLKTQPVVIPVTQLVPNVMVQMKMIVLLVSQMLLGMVQVDVKTTVVMKPSNVLKDGI